MKPILRRIVIVLVISVVVALILFYVMRDKPVSVVVQVVDSGRVEATVANTRSGTVKACRRARLAPATGGQIRELLVHEGDRVEAGQVLLVLWNEDLKAEVNLAESEGATSRANAEEACFLAEEAQRDADRLVRLRKQDLVSEADFDKAVTNAKARRANCEAARASVKMSAARIKFARAMLDHTILRAPFAGTVAEVSGELGEFVTPSPIGVATLPAVDLIDTSCLYVSAPIDEVDATAIRTGMEARITLDAFPKTNFKGLVRRIAPYVLEVEKQARTVEVETVFADLPGNENLLPGYSADVEIVLDLRDNVLRIPTEAILEGNRVLVCRRADGLIEERIIEQGLSNWQFTEVVSGLEAGELIVTSVDREGVKPGVRAEPESLPKGRVVQ
ncbi:MAG: efflux RND transporter periplasmic adaptor subunit [Deltaproteobacteria bacterium]|nr:efflux RND transporter periplasmic adaptor subunit [Deltaproteobacteria bacterium]